MKFCVVINYCVFVSAALRRRHVTCRFVIVSAGVSRIITTVCVASLRDCAARGMTRLISQMYCSVTAEVCLGQAAAAFSSPHCTYKCQGYHRCANNKHIYFRCSVGFHLRLICHESTEGPQLNTVLNVDRETRSVICLLFYLAPYSTP